MTLRSNITFSEHFEFSTAAELRDWLNQFRETDLSTVLFNCRDGSDILRFQYETETLSDGSEVNNIAVRS